MGIQLDKLVAHEGNVYEITMAAIKKAEQLANKRDPEVDASGEKLVTAAINMVLDNKVPFIREEQQ